MAVPIWPKLFALCDIGTSDRTGSVWAVGDEAGLRVEHHVKQHRGNCFYW